MHPCARVGYLYLLAFAWQTDDCTIPSDPIDLADKSGLGDELWMVHGPRILRKFHAVEGTDRLRNAPLYTRWIDAKAIYEARHADPDEVRRKRSEAGRKGNEKRWRKGDGSQIDRNCDSGESQTDRKQESESSQTDRYTETETETSTETQKQKQKQKPCRAQAATGEKTLPETPKPKAAKPPRVRKPTHSTDPRHMACKQKIWDYWAHHHPGEKVPWDGAEGKALGMFLRASPDVDADKIRKMLWHRSRSEVNHDDRPSRWIGTLNSYSSGPIDRYGKPMQRGNANGNQDPDREAKFRAITEQAIAAASRNSAVTR